MAEKLNPFYKLLQIELPINFTSDLEETFDSVNNALSDASELAMKQSIRGKQLVPMTDATFSSADHALMIETTPDQKYNQSEKPTSP